MSKFFQVGSFNNRFLQSVLTIALICPLTAFTFFQEEVNGRPEITDLKSIWNKKERRLIVSYDVTDREGDLLKTTIGIFDKEGKRLVINTDKYSGDTAHLINPGRRKKIEIALNDSVFIPFSVELIADDLKPFSRQQITDRINKERLKKLLLQIQGERTGLSMNAAQHHQSVQKMLTKYLKTGDYAVSKHSGDFRSVHYTNLVGSQRRQGEELLILGAHFDTKLNTPGVDDNASGIAAMIEIARALADQTTYIPVMFIAFDAEEQGFIGSQQFLLSNELIGHRKVRGYINMDMIGYYSKEPSSQVFPEELVPFFPMAYEWVKKNDFKGDFVFCFTNESSLELGAAFQENSKKNVPGLKVLSLTIPDNGRFAPDAFRGSDHISFWDAGIKALSVGDTGPARNPNYHRSTDSVDAVNLDFISEVAKATLATLMDLASVCHCQLATSKVVIK